MLEDLVDPVRNEYQDGGSLRQPQHQEHSMTRPNIILINCDDLGYGDLGCYGSERNETPALDRMAAEGVRFTDFYMVSPVCSPSRGAMMTGCYPPRIGFGEFGGDLVLFPGHAYGLHKDERTLPQLLREAGYRTMLIGKWHCGDQPEFLPTERGFDEYYGLPYSNNMGRQVGREAFPPLPLLRGKDVIQEQPDQSGLTERYTEEAVRFLRDNRERPFFLYLAHMYVHLPLFVPERFLDASRNGGYGGAGRPHRLDHWRDLRRTEAPRSGRRYGCRLHQRQRLACPGRRRQQRAAARYQGDYLGRRHARALYCPLARQDCRGPGSATPSPRRWTSCRRW